MYLAFPEPPLPSPDADPTSALPPEEMDRPTTMGMPPHPLAPRTGGEGLKGTDGSLEELPSHQHASDEHAGQTADAPEEPPDEQMAASTAAFPPSTHPPLQEADEIPHDLLKLISHELKTPITVVQGQIQLVERQLEQLLTQELLPLLAGQPDLEKKVRALSQSLHRGVQHSKRLSRLINDLLDLAHIQQGQWSLALEHCNLAALLRETVEDLQQLWPNRKLLLSLPATEQAPILADEVRIRQVISNYVSNAHKYSPANQPIELALHVEPEQARVFVRDHGPGLSPEQQARIWSRFYRVPGIQVQPGLEAGSGLGLTICRQLIAQHHGQVGVFSKPGEGSIFWFTLPLVRPAE